MTAEQRRAVLSRIDLPSFIRLDIPEIADYADRLHVRQPCARDLATVTKSELVDFLLEIQDRIRAESGESGSAVSSIIERSRCPAEGRNASDLWDWWLRL